DRRTAPRVLQPWEASLMLRLPRFMPRLALACSLSISVPLIVVNLSFGQDQPPASAPAAPAAAAAAAPAAPAITIPENEPLKDSVENFWHYAKIARYDIAAAEAQHILAQNADPQQLLSIFESV